MWILQKKVLVGGLQVYAYYSETSAADVNRDLSAAKEFKTQDDAVEFGNANALSGWTPVKFSDPGATALQPWELEK